MVCYKITKSGYKKQIRKGYSSEIRYNRSNPDIELEWDNLKNIVNDAAHDEIGVRINTKNGRWFDVDCRKAIKAKNEARKKCIIRDARTNKEEYIKRRNEDRKICGDKKREMINNEIKELEIENGKNENRNFLGIYFFIVIPCMLSSYSIITPTTAHI